MKQVAKKIEIMKSCASSDVYFSALYQNCLEYTNIEMHDYEDILEMNNQDFMSSFTGLISLISFEATPSTSQTDLEFHLWGKDYLSQLALLLKWVILKSE